MILESKDGNELGVIGWLSIALFLSIGLNGVQFVSSRIAVSHHSGPGSTTMNQSNLNYYYVDLRESKKLEDPELIDESDLPDDIATEPTDR